MVGCIVDGGGIGYQAMVGFLNQGSTDDRYDEVMEFEVNGSEARLYEGDFDKGNRLTRFNIETGKILEVGHYNCLE